MKVAAPALPWIEAVVGAVLLTGVFMPAALTAAAILMTVFSAGVLVNLLRGRQIDCGCRARRKPITWTLLAQDLAIGIACVTSVGQTPSGLLWALVGRGDLHPGEALALTCAVIDVWLIYVIAIAATSVRRFVTSPPLSQEVS